ncbi:SRPBCC family protein [Gordonia hongkongensis]|uniref:SRPBCC family protein n=1 Tax=Gordonia hongkongensis TaxID=1701090 RepID=UPI003EBBA053
MASIEVTKDFPLSAGDVWSWIGDTGAVAAWIPAIDASRMDGDVRHVVFTDGAPARERIVAFDEEARTYSYEYIDGRFRSSTTARPSRSQQSATTPARFTGQRSSAPNPQRWKPNSPPRSKVSTRPPSTSWPPRPSRPDPGCPAGACVLDPAPAAAASEGLP